MMSSNIDALFFYIFNPENPTCNINAEFMFNFVIQDTLISPLVLLLDFLDTQDYLSGSSISPKLESAFHGEIFESLFQIEVKEYYRALRFNRKCYYSNFTMFRCCIYLEPGNCWRRAAFYIQLDVDGLPFRSLDFLAWFSRKFYCLAFGH